MLIINQAVAPLKYAQFYFYRSNSHHWFFLFFSFLKIESKKLDFKEKAKPRTDSGKHETMTTGGDGASASATVDEEHQKEIEPSDEVFESEKKW